MRKLSLILNLALCLITSNVWAKNYCNNDAQACYLMKEGTGTTVADSSSIGSGGTATFNSSGHPAWSSSLPTFPKGGSPLNSLNYSTSGSAEILTSGTSNNLMPYNAAWTVCTWINPTTDSVNADERIVARGSVYFAISATKLLYIQIDGVSAGDFFTANNAITFNTWQNVCASTDGGLTTANWKIYVNGVSQSKSSGGNLISATSNAGATLYIGNRSDGLRSLGGAMTDVIFWNRQISDAEALDQYNNGPTGQTAGFFQLMN